MMQTEVFALDAEVRIITPSKNKSKRKNKNKSKSRLQL